MLRRLTSNRITNKKTFLNSHKDDAESRYIDGLITDFSEFDAEALRAQEWTQDNALSSLPGYEEVSVVLVSNKVKRYLLLIESQALQKLRQSDLIERFDATLRSTRKLECQTIFIATVEELLLAQSQLLQQRNLIDETTGDRKTGAYRNFDLIVEKAIEVQSSDVHFEFREDHYVRVRHRIHGKLRELSNNLRLAHDYAAMLDAVSAAYNSRADPSSRSHNHFDETQHQSCSIPMVVKNRKYQLRFQSIKENRGVDIILRILLNEVRDDDVLSLSMLGYSDDQVEILEDAIHRSPGLLIVAGETGSGKSTTLRTLMTYERDSGKKFYSIEDPVEYIQGHVTQIPIQRRAEGVSDSPFTAASKVLLRGDPDKVMPGEIRDHETGSFAKSMTETGHQVLSTVHASSCFGIVPRLVSEEIGMPLAAVSSPNFLTAMVYQKLIPVLCPDCRLPASSKLSEDYLSILIDLGLDTNNIYVTGPGCVRCGQRGTLHQTVVAEVCELTDELLDLIRASNFWEAEKQWRALSNHRLNDGVMLGKTALEHAIYKMSLGKVDPLDIESAFYPLRKYHRYVSTRSSG